MTQVQRTLATLGGVAVLAAGLGGYAWWQTRQDAQKKASEQKQAQLVSFEPAKANALTVVAKGETTVLAKGADGWKITSPVQARADEGTVQTLLDQLSQLKSQSTVEEHGAASLAKFGLDKPSARLTVGWPGGGTEVALGSVNSYSGGQYATRSGSDAVLLLSGSHDAVLARTTFDLRDKHLARVPTDSLSRIEVDAAPDRYTLERDGAGWKVVEPRPERADDAVVNKVVSVLNDLRATAIADEKGEDLSKWGLDKPVATLTLVGKDGSRTELLLGKAKVGTDERGFARASTGPMVAQVPVDAAAPLHQSLEALEDKTVARVDRNAVAAMEFTTSDGKRVLLQRKKAQPDAGALEKWAVLAPKSGDAKTWKVNSLLYLFSNLKASKIAAETQTDLAKYGLDKPKQTATLQDVAGKALASLKFGKEDGSVVYAIADGDPRVFAVEKSRLTELPKTGDEVLDTPPATAKN